jgi:hypothetical protein
MQYVNPFEAAGIVITAITITMAVQFIHRTLKHIIARIDRGGPNYSVDICDSCQLTRPVVYDNGFNLCQTCWVPDPVTFPEA